jgi:hypothetical protein
LFFLEIPIRPKSPWPSACEISVRRITRCGGPAAEETDKSLNQIRYFIMTGGMPPRVAQGATTTYGTVAAGVFASKWRAGRQSGELND